MLLCVTTSPIRTSGTMAKPLSLTALTPAWIWGSMSPGVTCLSVASISIAPRGASRSGPTATTFPACIKRSAFSICPSGPWLHTVALRTTTAAGCSGIELRPNSIMGRINGRSISGTFIATVPRAAPSYASVRDPRKDGFDPLGREVHP